MCERFYDDYERVEDYVRWVAEQANAAYEKAVAAERKRRVERDRVAVGNVIENNGYGGALDDVIRLQSRNFLQLINVNSHYSRLLNGIDALWNYAPQKAEIA